MLVSIRRIPTERLLYFKFKSSADNIYPKNDK